MEDKKITVRAVERALDILLCFVHSNEMSLTDIAQQTSLNKSTVYRLLASLEGKGFLMRDPGTEKYRLGFRIWELSANLTQAADPAMILLPELEKLRDSLGETISLYVRDGMERIRIQAVESNQSIRRVAPIGARMSLAVGASSKVLMSYADPHSQEAILNDPSWPDWVDKRLYKKQLEEIKEKGYATSFEEREPGAAAVAVPILNRSGHLIAALSVSGPSSRLTLDKMDKFLPEILDAASRMGKMVK
ncbi:IclR family transcriptional regulator [Microaerobacter geothermalis]|uniref:IclR family transcriptional regulator n=1 Tax=Microaerobacter geothermalis TaxID=674972 RepID=UPI001F2600E8|nr:IclR family transcriptional regulator [Microaerobacter geothermalis]MCF6094235.1 IclR family transcriptional regulator [Microaerobacter geothermalis]